MTLRADLAVIAANVAQGARVRGKPLALQLRKLNVRVARAKVALGRLV